MRLTHAVLCFGLLLTGAALAKDDPGFLARSDLYDTASFLPPPPAAGSPASVAELAEVKRKMAEASPAEVAEARSDNDNENGTIFAAALGPSWDLGKLPATAKLIDDVTGSEGPFSDIAKGESIATAPGLSMPRSRPARRTRFRRITPLIPAAMPRSALPWESCLPI